MNPKHGQPWPKKNANKNVTKKPFYTYQVTKKKKLNLSNLLFGHTCGKTGIPDTQVGM